MDDIKLFAKNEKETGDPDINDKNIQPEYRNGIWHRKMRNAYKEIGERESTEGIEMSNQERIRSLGGKETYKYLGILEVNTIKQVEIKEKKT